MKARQKNTRGGTLGACGEAFVKERKRGSSWAERISEKRKRTQRGDLGVGGICSGVKSVQETEHGGDRKYNHGPPRSKWRTAGGVSGFPEGTYERKVVKRRESAPFGVGSSNGKGVLEEEQRRDGSEILEGGR